MASAHYEVEVVRVDNNVDIKAKLIISLLSSGIKPIMWI